MGLTTIHIKGNDRGSDTKTEEKRNEKVYTKFKRKMGGFKMNLSSLLRHGVGEPDEYELKRPYYLMKRDGVYRHTSTGALLIKERFANFGGIAIPGLKDGSEGVDYLLPKIPFKYWLMFLDFYKEIYQQFRTEASAHIYYNMHDVEIPEEFNANKVGLIQDGKWLIYCPQQVNHGTLTSFGSDELYQWFIANTVAVVETHSHHTMDAFWSGTDDRNHQGTQYYGVYGRINTEDKFLLTYVINGKRTTVPVTEIFEFPMLVTTEEIKGIEGYSECFGDVELRQTARPYDGTFQRQNEFPPEWVTECNQIRKEYTGPEGREARRQERKDKRNKGKGNDTVDKGKTSWYVEDDNRITDEQLDLYSEGFEAGDLHQPDLQNNGDVLRELVMDDQLTEDERKELEELNAENEKAHLPEDGTLEEGTDNIDESEVTDTPRG